MKQSHFRLRLSPLILICTFASAIAACSIVLRGGELAASPIHWRIRTASPTEFPHQRSEWMILDAREYAAYEKSHIPGALPLSEAKWDEQITAVLDLWDPQKNVLIYCDRGACGTRGRVALRLLADLPDVSIFILKGGFEEWRSIHYVSSKQSS